MLTPDGKIKPWGEMTPEERVVDNLRHFPTLLNRWKGGYAKFWGYSVSHHSFVIRIERAGVKGNLEIACTAEHICGPVAWDNANDVAHTGQDDRILEAIIERGEKPQPVALEWSAQRTGVLFAVK
jgi:hypothetical protein